MIDTLPLLPNDRLGRFDSRYRIVLVAAQRAKQLMQGSKQTKPSKYSKEASIALEETMQGGVEFLIGESARQAIKEGRQVVVTQPDPPLLAGKDEDAREIEKQLGIYVDDSPNESPKEEDK